MSGMSRTWGVVLVALVATVANAQPETLANRAAAIERASQAPDGVRVVLGHLSRRLGLSVETLRAQKAQFGLNWGDLLIAHRVSRAADLPLEDIVAEFRSGKTWEEVAAARHVDVAPLVGQVQQSEEIVEQRSEDKPAPAIGDHSMSSPGRGGGGRGRR